MKIKLIPLVGLLAIVAGASAQVTLEIKHQEKSSLTTQTDIKIAQTLELAGQEIKTKNAQVLITEQATGARVGDGTIRTKSTIKKWTAKWEFPGGIAMEFNSAVPDRKAPIAQLEPILEIVRVMLNTPITHVYGKDDLVKTVEIPEDAAKGLPDDFKDELNPKKLAAQLKDLQAILPDKAVSNGDTWVRDQKSNLGGGQVMSFRIDYKYEGTVKAERPRAGPHHGQGNQRGLYPGRRCARATEGEGQRVKALQVQPGNVFRPQARPLC